ncbi:MAG: hypothetical protein GY847_16110 [Proteobacteria bacterium]|nr:hypothetical protein [Pseudomonadota bacterium]
MRTVLSICFVTLVLFVVAEDAFAQSAWTEAEGDVVVLLISMEKCCPDKAWPTAEKAMLAELATLNLTIDVADGRAVGDKEQRAELRAMANKKNAAYALRISQAPDETEGRVDLCINDKASEDTTFRYLMLMGKTDSEAAAVATLRAVEAIRADLLEQQLKSDNLGNETGDETGDEPSDETSDEPTEEEELSEPTPETKTEPGLKNLSVFYVGLGAEALGAPGGAGALGAAHLKLGWSPLPILSAEVDTAVSVLSQKVEEDEANSSFDIALIRVWAMWEILDHGLLRPSLGPGGGVVISWATGIPSDHPGSRTDRTVSTYLGATGRLGFAFAKRFWVRIGARVGFLMPEVTIAFLGEDAARFGRPMIEGFFNLEIRFP